jgi:superfamily II DNA or RNA helicase
MSEFWIRYLDPVESIMSVPLYKLIKEHLSYPSVYYRSGPFKKSREEFKKSTFIGHNKEGYFFYTGFIPRVRQFCIKRKISLQEIGIETYGLTYKEPKNIPVGMDPRTFQISMAKTIIDFERGVLKAPTGTGKTSLGLYVISCLDGLGNVLWLSHTKDLMNQTAIEAVKWFGKDNVGRVGDGHLQLGRFFTSATRQTFKDHAEVWGTDYDMVVLDEVQHLSDFPTVKDGKEMGEYGTIFKKIFAPIRLGLTATMPDDLKARLAIEALIGPLLEEFTIDEAKKQGYMATTKIKIIKIPKSERISQLRKYADVYEWGIVRRLERNKIIIDIVEEHQKKNESVLIVVNKIEHGRLLKNLGDKRNLEIEFVNGSTDTETRESIKRLLNTKQMKCGICTSIWKEGTNIPELNAVINAAGGKSELTTIQVIGRGLRKTESKSELIVYDFFDPSHIYLIDHFGNRFSVYCDMGWIG